MNWMAARPPGAAAPQPLPPGGPKNTGSSRHSSSSGCSGARRPALRAASGRSPISSSSASNTAAYGLSRSPQRLADRTQDVRAVAEHLLRLGERPQREVLEHHRQVVGQLAAARARSPARCVDLLEVDHRLAAVARIAVDVLEQVQRRRAAAVEQRDVALLRVERGRPRRARRAAASSAAARRRGSRASASIDRARSRAARRRARPSGRRAARPAPSVRRFIAVSLRRRP